METDLHLTGKSGNDSDETQHRRCLINWFYTIAIIFVLFLPSINYAQSGLCDAGVPFEVVDLSSSADATWISPTITRANLCCGLSNPDRCLEFEITLHPDAIAINFDIASGAVPPGAMFYQINCGPPVAVGTPVCISGVGPHTLTFCKPGNNANTYAVTSIPDPSITDPNFATENCPAPLTITGMVAGSITITDLTGGGTYLSYLSCTNCENPIVTPTGAFPAYADYEICGTPAGSVCLATATYCDTVRVYFYDTIVTNINPNPAEFCAGEAGVWLYSDVTHGVPPYVYEWYDQHDGLGNLLSTNEDYFATTAGNYSLIVYDSLYPQCGPFIVNTTVIENPNPTLTFIPNSPYLCENDSIDISVNGALSYSWSPGTGLSSTTGANVTAFPTSTTTYTVTGTDVNGCTTSTDITVMVCSAPPVVASAGGDICLGESFQLQANGALVYEWSPATGLNDPNISDPIATPTVTTDYIVTGYDASCTVIENGDFSNGNTGFTTEYNYSSNLFPEGNYMIGTNPNTYHTSFATCGDHTTGSDNMMIVNGNTVANQEVWCQNITVRPNTDYIFSTWITSVHPSNPAVLQFSIDGTLLGSPFTATSTTCDWNEFYEVWNSGASTSIQICIVNQNTIASGNDFAIDDVFFAPLCPATDTVTVVVHDPPTISFSNTGPFCETEPATNLLANPTGGTWSGTGITDAVNGTFNPGTAGSGTHLIQYSYNDGYCQVDTSINIIVDAVVDATITPVGPFCETDGAVGLTAVSPGGTWSGTGVVGNTFDPTVALPGDHIIQYNIVNGACSDSDTETIHVDAAVDATITPVGPFCETDAAVILNAVSPGGTWSGTGIVGNTFDPTIALAGDHIIQYDVVNGACSDSDTETIHVDATVDATITPVGPFCETDGAVGLTAVSPGGTWSGTGVVGNTFDPTVALAGDHIIQYDIVNGACSDTDTETIHVDAAVDATITPIGPFCETDAAVVLTAVSPGGTWSGTGVVGNTFDPTIALAGDHIIQYDVVNGACSDSDTETIHVDAAVDATITPVGPFCETDATVVLTAVSPGGTWSGTGIVGNNFDPTVALAGDHIIQYDIVNGACSDSDTETIHVDAAVDATITPVGPFCETDAAVVLTAVSPGGTWSGTGIVGNNFDPMVALPGDHIIQYDIVNGACSDTDTETIHVDAAVDATITPVGPFCETDAAVVLTAVSPGGTWSGTGVVGNTFDPTIALAGNHIIQYNIVNGACSDSDTETIHVDDAVDATITPVGPFCETDAAVVLTAVSPGGTWSGTGVVGNTFDPTIALAGDHIIQYDIVNGACSDTDTETIHVDAAVDATITPVGPFCETDAAVVLTAVSPGGTWSGTGVVGNTFDPTIAIAGDHIIQYDIVNGACSDSDTETIHVDAAVDATITPVGPFCETDVAVVLTAVSPGGTWSGTGIVGNNFDPMVALPGDHIIQYDVVNGACSDSDTETIHVDAAVDATITPVGPFCETDAAVVLTAVSPGGTWSGTGVVVNTFDPTIALAGDHIIQYDIVNGACSDSDTETIHVDAAVDATITPVGPFCETDAAVILNAVSPGGTWSGTGIVGNNFDPMVALPGDHIIQYDIVNGACSDTDTETIHVDAAVDATITPVGPFCETDVAVVLTAVSPGGTWSGTGVVGNTFDPTVALAGNHIIQYDVVNGACSDSDTETIHVDAAVDATITPVGPFCETDAAVILNAVSPGGTWSGTGIVGNTFDPMVALPGDHIIQYDIVNGACSDTDTETIHVDAAVDATITPVGPFCETDVAVVLTAVSPGGTWSGTGVVGNTFDPTVALAGNHIIQYDVVNGACSDSDTETIHVDAAVDATITPVGPFCETDAAVVLTAISPGGTWSGTGVVGNNFDPMVALPGDHIIQYDVVNGACSDSDTETIHVDAAVDATITPVGPFCETDAAVVLTAVSPGGTWSGTGVVGNTFDPTIALAGDHIIQYDIVNGACSDSDTETIHVDAAVDATITPVGPFCETDAAVVLTAVSPGGTWSGNGVVGNNFDPMVALPGDHIIQYDIVNGACSDSDTETIHVDAAVDATITPVGPFCETDAAVILNALSSGGNWSGAGVVGNTFDPTIALAGDHIIQYDIVNGACSDSDTETIHVDAVVDATITPVGPFCETDAAVVLTAVSPGGTWSGTGVVGNTFDPTIANAGDHIIQYDIVNGACSDTNTETIHVDAAVDATITPVGPFCETDAAVILTAISTGGTWSGTGIVGNTFDPTVALAGDHIIQYNIVNGACSDSDTETIHVDAAVDATITPVGPFCEINGAVALTAVSSGGIWSGTGVTGNNFFPATAGSGDHIIQYDIVNGACSDTDTETIHVDAAVDATITPVGPFCETDGAVGLTAVSPGGTWSGTGVVGNTFDPTIALAGDHIIQYDVVNGACSDSDTETIHVDATVDATITPVGPFCETDAAVVLTAVSPGGTWSGTGVVGNNFDPMVALPGDHIIQYDIVNGACSDSDTETIHVDAAVDATITPVGPFCETDGAVGLTAVSPGGTWSGTGVVGNTFDPTIALAGDHIIQYDVVNGACSDSDAETIHVDAVVDATITPVGPFCETDAAVVLTAVSPGGTWSGTGVVGNNFDPTIALAGDHIIQYDIVNGACSDTDTETIHVDAAVDATITPVGPFCETDAAVVLNAVSPGGTWSGTGVVGNTFDPTIALAGDHIIQYDVVNGACSDSDTETIHVDAAVDATITPVGPFCETDAAVVLTAVSPGGTWSGTGIVGNTFDPTIALAGDHIIQYDIVNGACFDTNTETIHVDAAVDATITPVGPFCETDAAVILNAVSPSGTWSGTGIVGNTFDPTIALAGDHIIQYDVVNGACSDSDTETIHVDAAVDATITPVGPFCETDAAVILTAISPGGTWSGTGIVGNTFDPTIALAGDHIIQYDIVNGACSDSDTEIMVVHGSVDATITPIGPFCDNDISVNLTAVTSGGSWSGNGIIDAVAGVFSPSAAALGDNIITYSVGVGACSDTDQITIHIDGLIEAIITPVAPICEDNGVVTLTATNPGGIWTGNFMVGNTFDPMLAGQGDHTVNYQIVNGACSDTDQITIHVDTIPDASITPAGPYCQDFEFAYLSAVSPGGTWSGTGVTNPATGQFSPLFSGPGDFLINYEIINGVCSDNDSFTIHVDEFIDPTITPIDAICQTGDPITLHAANPGGIWAGQGIIDPINGILDPSLVENGDNTMTYTITNGACQSSDLHIYQVDPAVDATILSNPGNICVDAAPFVLNSVQSGGIWSGQGISNPNSGAYNPSLAGAGNHEIIYHLESGTCEDSDTIYISVDAIPDATITIAGPLCETDPAIILTAATPGGVWSGTGVMGNTFDPSLAGSGDHIITYIVNNGACSNSDTQTIHVDAMPDATINPVDPICENSAPITLSSVEIGGTWSGPSVSGNQFNPTIAGQGNHLITYEIINGTCSDIDNITIIVDDYTPVSITPAGPFCANDNSVNLNASIAGGQWNGQGISDPINGTFDPSMSGVGTFNINYTFNNGSCISNSSTQITVNPNPVAIITNIGSTYCEGDAFVVVTTSPPGGSLSGPGVDNFVFNPADAGPGIHTLIYDVSNIYGCSDNTQTNITVIESPTVNINLPDNEFCIDDDAENLIGNPPGGIFEGPGVVNNKFIPVDAGPGTHEITYTYIDANGCTGIGSMIVEVSEPLQLEVLGQNLICFGENTGQASVSTIGGVPPYSYQWDDPLSSTTTTISNLSSGLYSVTVTDSWGCDKSGSVNIISPSELNVFISSSSNADCFGNSNGNVQAGVSGGTPPYTYIWDDDLNSTTSYINNLEAGDYHVTITDNNGCSGTTGVTITQPDEIISVISSSTDVTCNGGNNGSATVSVSGGTEPYNFLWNNPSQTPISTANHLSAGTYQVTITDANGCSTTSSATIAEPSAITSTTNHTDVVCTHSLGSASILVNGGVSPYSYAWSNGNTTTSCNNLAAGEYFITTTDANNCQHYQNLTVGLVGNIHTNIHEVQGILCYNSNEAILQGYSNNGTNPLNYLWSNGTNTEYNNHLSPGHYEVTIIDDWGCTGSNSYDIDNVPQINVVESITSVGCAGDETGAITIQVNGGTPSYLINWSTGTTGLSISGISPGNYSLTVTDANSCTISETYYVGTANPISLDLLIKNISCYGYNDGAIQVNAIGGTPPFTYSWTYNGNNFAGSSASNLSIGEYSITVSDTQGCKIDTVATITQPEEIDYSYFTIDPSCIGNDDGYIEITVIGGHPPYIYQWGDQTASIEYISGLMQGTYTFTITDSNGCMQATEAIKLTDTDVDCIAIPNAFTPNNDGTNDTWIIENIEIFPWALIQVFNRWGQLVFEGYGSGDPWDGTWNGNIVPTGSYIYTVDLFNGTKYCGIVTVVQ